MVWPMKSKIVVAVLVVLCVLLGIWLVVSRKQAATDKQTATGTIQYLSNQVMETSAKLDEQKQVNLNLEKDLTTTNQYLAQLSNDLNQTIAGLNTNLTKTSAELDAARQSIKAAQDDLARRDARITELEAENVNLDKRATELTNAITALNGQITETQRKLAAAEGDKAFLEKELKRLMAEKADLEQKFNDLEILRAQVKHLREELAVARRLEWIRKGLWGAGTETRGAQLLMQKPKPEATSSGESNRYDLNVEIKSDGSVRVIPPATNSAPANPPPAK